MRGFNRDVIMISIPDTPPGLSCSANGRSPDSRVAACPILPERVCSVVIIGFARRSQLRGQSRFWRLMAIPHRIPFSSQTHFRRPRTIGMTFLDSSGLVKGMLTHAPVNLAELRVFQHQV